MSIKPTPVVDRFNNMVIRSGNPDDCWGWRGSKSEHGYGRMHVDRKGYPQKAHRVSWRLHNGEIPDGLDVLHRCDNPECTNPRNLFLGTHADNMADASRKGRWEGKGRGISRNAGEQSPKAKLTDEQVAQIRQSVADGQSQRSVAATYGIRPSHVSAIVSGKARSSPDYPKRRRKSIAEHAAEILIETGGSSVMWGDVRLIHEIVERAGREPRGPKTVAVVLAALEKSPLFEKRIVRAGPAMKNHPLRRFYLRRAASALE